MPPIIHVAGTNGKGSTIAFLRAIAEAAGLRVHAFTKPHIVSLTERFIVGGEMVDEDVLVAAAEHVARVAPTLTQFDAQVASAFTLFAAAAADLVLLETGMGGRDDSTNVVTAPAASVFTPIALDHQDALGATLAEIAAHKAGILKPRTPAFVARQEPEVMAVIEARAEAIHAPLHRQGIEWDAFAKNGRLVVQTETRALDLPLPSLQGAHQIDNAGLAGAVFLGLPQFSIEDDAFARGVASATLPGRLQALTRGPLAEQARAAGAELWIDSGHNAHAADALAAALRDLRRKRPARTALIVGLRARKDWRAFVEALAPSADHVIAVPVTEGAPSEAIADQARAQGAEAHTAENIKHALDVALNSGAKRVLVCGSFLLTAEALRA